MRSRARFDVKCKASEQKWWLENRLQITRPFQIIVNDVREDSKLILTLHLFHGLYDGLSLSVLLDKVKKEYVGHTNIAYGPRFLDVLSYGLLVSNAESRRFWVDQ